MPLKATVNGMSCVLDSTDVTKGVCTVDNTVYYDYDCNELLDYIKANNPNFNLEEALQDEETSERARSLFRTLEMMEMLDSDYEDDDEDSDGGSADEMEIDDSKDLDKSDYQ